MEKKKLILGAIGCDHPKAITVDCNAALSPDVVHDLNITPWPFRDNQFEKVTCYHVIEHFNSINSCIQELYRICSTDGEIYIEVPHHSAYYANAPDHKLRFNYFSLDCYLDTMKRNRWITAKEKFRLLERKVTFHRSFRRVFLHKLFNKCPLSYERFWTYIFPAEHLVFRIQPIK